MAESSNNNYINSNNGISSDNNQQIETSKSTGSGQEDLYLAAMKAIEDDNLERMELIFNLEQFNKSSLDNLIKKACERSKGIDEEENFVRNNPNMSNCAQDELSMINICQTSRKNNQKLVQSLLKARCKAEEVDNNNKLKLTKSEQKSKCSMSTPTKPKLRSLEKKQLTKTPELPNFKSKVNRQLKF